jgi:hypothetical protein
MEKKKFQIPEELLDELKRQQMRLEDVEKEIIQSIFESLLLEFFPIEEDGTFFKDGKFLCQSYSNFSYRTDYLGLVADTSSCSVEMKNIKEDGKIQKISCHVEADSCDSGSSSSQTISIDNILVVNSRETDSGYREYCGEEDEDEDEDEIDLEDEDKGMKKREGGEKDEPKKKKTKRKFSAKEIEFVRNFFDRVEEFLFSRERGGGWGMKGRWNHCH